MLARRPVIVAFLGMLTLAGAPPAARAALDSRSGPDEGLKLSNAPMARELASRAARLGVSASNADTTFVGYTPGAPGAGGANYWSIGAGAGKDGYYRPVNGAPHKGNWNWEEPVNGDSLQGWWPLRNVYATTGGLTMSDRNRPWWAIDIGNDANYRINQANGRTFGVLGVWHRDGGSLAPGPVLAPLWTPPSGAHAAWMGLRAHGDATYADAVTGNAFNEDVIAYTGFNAASPSGNDQGFPGYGSQMDQLLYRDIDVASSPAADLTVRFKFQTVMSTGIGTTASTRTGWFDCCPVGQVGGGPTLPASQRNNFISSSEAGDALAPRDSFMVYVGAGVESLWTDPTGAQTPVYDAQRRWFGEVLRWERDPGSNPANPQPLHYRQLLSVAGDWPANKAWTVDGFVDTAFTIPNAVLAPFASGAGRVRLVFRVKTNRGFDDQGTAYNSGRKGAAVVDRVSYTLTGDPEVVFGDFENAGDIDNDTNVSAVDAWKSTGKPPAIYDHVRTFSDLLYEDLCGQKGDVSRVCNMSGVVISSGDYDNGEVAGGLVSGTAERDRNNGFMSPTVSFADDDGNPNTKNVHGLYGPGGNGGVGDVVATGDYHIVYDLYSGIMDPFTKGNLWRFAFMSYPSNAKVGYGYPAWGQMRFSTFIYFNPDKQCLSRIDAIGLYGMLRTSNPSGTPDSVRIFLGKTQQCFRFGVSIGCAPTDGCYWDNVALAIVDGTPAPLGVQIWDWFQDTFPANETAGYPGVAALFDTTAALIKTGLNVAQATGNALRYCVPGDSVAITSSATTARVDLVFRILPGPGNYQPVGRPDQGLLRRVPSNSAMVTKGDGSFWDEYRQVPGDFASPNAVVLHHNAEGGWDANVWNSARCDTAGHNIVARELDAIPGPPTSLGWASTLHEADPHFNTLGILKNICYIRCLACSPADIRCDGGQPDDYPLGPGPGGTPGTTTTKEFTKIIPDGLLTPGSHVQYFFRSQQSEAPGALYGMIPDTNTVFPQIAEGSSDGHRWQQFGVLPNRWKSTSYRHPVTRLFGNGPSSMLVVDNNDRRGNERVWVNAADSSNAGCAPSSYRYWGAHNGWHAVPGADPNDPAGNRRGSDGQPGFVVEHLGQPGTGAAWDMYQVKGSEALTTVAGSLGSRLAFRGGSALVANKTSRQGPTPEMLSAYYSQILFLSGDLRQGILGPYTNRSQNDAGILTSWMQAGNTGSQNRGFWAIGGGFVESSWFTAVTSIQNTLLSNYLGVGLVDGDYTTFTGNTDELLDLRLLPQFQDKITVTYYGIRNLCVYENDVLNPDGVGLYLGSVASEYARRGDGSAVAPAGVFKDWDVTSPWKTLVDGWDLDDLTSRNDINTAGRRAYIYKVATNVWSKIYPIFNFGFCPGDAPATDVPLVDFVGAWANNPMLSGTASIPFGLARPERVEIRIHDVSGRRIRTLADRLFAAGEHRLVWDGLDDHGRKAPRGVYFTSFAGPLTAARKITLLK